MGRLVAAVALMLPLLVVASAVVGAQDEFFKPVLDVSPSTVQAGGAVTVSSREPACPEGRVRMGFTRDALREPPVNYPTEWTPFYDVSLPGSWSFTVAAPSIPDVRGGYGVFAECVRPDGSIFKYSYYSYANGEPLGLSVTGPVHALIVIKEVVGGGSATPFAFTLSCGDAYTGTGTRQVEFSLAADERVQYTDWQDLDAYFPEGVTCTITEDPQGASHVLVHVTNSLGQTVPVEQSVVAGRVVATFTTTTDDADWDVVFRNEFPPPGGLCAVLEEFEALVFPTGLLVDPTRTPDPYALRLFFAEASTLLDQAALVAPPELADQIALVSQGLDAIAAIVDTAGWDASALTSGDRAAIANISDDIAPALAALETWFEDKCATPTPTATPAPVPAPPTYTG